jgi:predicted regulator of Ras-like GTPase activity (Roadblock/LC7/MglB family)
MGLDLTKFGPGLKAYYSNQRVENMTYKDYPFFAMIPKKKDFFGKNYPLPIQIGNPQGRSKTFAKAKANQTSSVYKDFTLTRVKDYSLATVDNETAEASENDKGAFLKALTNEIDSAIKSMSIAMASAVYGDGSGVIGQIAAISANEITLVEPDDVVMFDVGQSIVFAAAKSTGGLRAAGAKLVVTKVDRSAGKISFDANIATIAGVVVNDYLFVDGDRNLAMAGLAAWLPFVAPTSGDNFFGVDRSVDPTRLGGVRFDGSALTIEEALVKGLTLCNREGGNPKLVFMNYTDWANLELALGSKVQYMVTQAFGRADIGFQGIQIKTNKGVANCVADPFCPKGYAYGITMESFALYSLKEPVRILDLDGNKLLRASDDDAVELRVGGYFNIGCDAPGHNVVIKL